ncbi:MAG: EpsG family protein [Rhodoferax sp.]
MTTIVINRVKIFELLALIGTISLSFFSGWRVAGIDRENYLLIYDAVLSTEDLTVKLFYAKDVAFLLLIGLANYFTSNPKLAFLLVCTISVAAKYFAVKRMAPQHLLGFFVTYAIFLSPGLEFAAMRSGLAIGFLMLALAYSERLILFIVFSLLTVASHMALLPVVLLAYRPVNELFARYKILYVIIAVLISSTGTLLIDLFPHGDDYAENKGTLFAYTLPVIALIISKLVFYRFDKVSSIQSKASIFHFLTISKSVIYGLIAIAFGISGVVVTASTRYLEVAWCLLLFSALILHRKTYANFIGLLVLISFLSYLNIYRSTWLAIIDPNLWLSQIK